MTRLVSLYDYVGVTDKELSFKKEEKFELLNGDHADWWFVKSCVGGDGREGYVPATYMRALEADESAPDEQPQQSESIPIGAGHIKAGSSKSANSQLDSVKEEQRSDEETESSEESEDLSDTASDEDTEASGSESGSEDEESEEAEKDLRNVLQDLKKRKSVFKIRKVRLMSTSKDAIDHFPAGFRLSALGKSYQSGNGHASQFLTPELNSTGMAFKDLHLGKKHTIRKRLVKCNLAFSIMDAKAVSNPAPLKVVGRMVRMALFDKTNIVSNIHSVPAFLQTDNENVWKFSTKSSILFPKDDENSCFIRTVDIDIKLCMLFELVLIARKDESSDETIEVSCGWSLLPLFTTDGRDLESKTYDMQIFGGGPSEKDVALAPSTPRPSGFFSKLLSGPELPRLTIKVWKLSKQVVSSLNDLPDVLVGNLSSVPVLSFYRRVLANTLVSMGKEKNYGSLYEPILALLPQFMEETDLLRFLVEMWGKKLKGMPRRDKKSYSALKNHFTSCVLSLWPLLFLELPPLVPGNVESSLARSSAWQKIQTEGVVSFLSRASLQVKRFDMQELEFHYLKVHSRLNPSQPSVAVQ
ncbi:hypothetical protein HDV03_001167 [Kappamyces sp. JEL0829]|nr:hypothetical protein HDV03_001167 [Kappamyces sp. JEL0829]